MMVGVKGQSQKDKQCMIPLTCGTKSSQALRQKIKWWVPGMGEGVIGELVFRGYRVSIWEGENFFKMDNSGGCTMMFMYLMPLNCTLKTGKQVSFLLCIFYYNLKSNLKKEFLATLLKEF